MGATWRRFATVFAHEVPFRGRKATTSEFRVSDTHTEPLARRAPGDHGRPQSERLCVTWKRGGRHPRRRRAGHLDPRWRSICSPTILTIHGVGSTGERYRHPRTRRSGAADDHTETHICRRRPPPRRHSTEYAEDQGEHDREDDRRHYREINANISVRTFVLDVAW